MGEMVATQNAGAILEQVVVGGDLSRLKPEDRLAYYRQVCESMGLNPLTQPFRYIKLNGKLTLYATRAAADQLRKLNGVSITNLDVDVSGDMAVVTCSGKDDQGRADTDVGVVALKNLGGDARANAILKAVTKAKRRMTLSLCGLGWLDETEVETIPDAEPVTVTTAGEIAGGKEERPRHWIDDATTRRKFWAWARDDMALTTEQVYDALGVEHVHDFAGSKNDAFKAIEDYVEAMQESDPMPEAV